MPTLFTKIINGEIPSYRVYEDEFVFAFLDIFPFQPGHTLIVPKIEVDYFVDVPELYYIGVFNAAKKLAPAIQKVAIGSQRVGMMVQGVDVPHFHLHLIPIFENQPFTGKKKSIEKSEMIEIQNKIIQELG